MGKTIGFANTFYTLWDVWDEMMYTTDAYGKAWPSCMVTHHNYIKNISTSLDKAKKLYPGIPIDDELKGRSLSFTTKREEDLTPELIKFGKYKGRFISEIADIDFNYILWLSNNSYGKLRKACEKLPQVISYKKDQQDKLDLIQTYPAGDISLNVTFDRNLSIDDNGSMAIYWINQPGLSIKLIFKRFREYAYKGHVYALPYIGNTPKRIKGKLLELKGCACAPEISGRVKKYQEIKIESLKIIN